MSMLGRTNAGPGRPPRNLKIRARPVAKTAVYAALVGNILVAATKTGAALWTGSSAMMSEAVHSVIDTSNELLLLYGYHRASRPPTRPRTTVHQL